MKQEAMDIYGTFPVKIFEDQFGIIVALKGVHIRRSRGVGVYVHIYMNV